MAANTNEMSLTEDDVPGAIFLYSLVEKHSVEQLKRWLKCRGLKTSGKKSILIQRCQNCIDCGASQLIDPGIDDGYWLKTKEAEARSCATVSVNTILPINGWKPLCELEDNMPIITDGHIFYYIVESHPASQ
ncbi:uncharacterized protein LOC144344312, partial [Saccoglossus kowalevskii]